MSLLMAVPATVLYYTVYEDFLGRLEGAGAGNVAAPITAGASARILATYCMAPLELVRTRIQSTKTPATAGSVSKGFGLGNGVLSRLPLATVGRAVSTVFREEGPLALWRGVGTTLWRDVPFSMVYWLGYENLKVGLGCGRGNAGDSGAERESADFLMRSFAAGAMSGVVASLLTHPFDVAKTQQQVLVQGVEGEFGSLLFSIPRIEGTCSWR